MYVSRAGSPVYRTVARAGCLVYRTVPRAGILDYNNVWQPLITIMSGSPEYGTVPTMVGSKTRRFSFRVLEALNFDLKINVG